MMSLSCTCMQDATHHITQLYAHFVHGAVRVFGFNLKSALVQHSCKEYYEESTEYGGPNSTIVLTRARKRMSLYVFTEWNKSFSTIRCPS